MDRRRRIFVSIPGIVVSAALGIVGIICTKSVWDFYNQATLGNLPALQAPPWWYPFASPLTLCFLVALYFLLDTFFPFRPEKMDDIEALERLPILETIFKDDQALHPGEHLEIRQRMNVPQIFLRLGVITFTIIIVKVDIINLLDNPIPFALSDSFHSIEMSLVQQAITMNNELIWGYFILLLAITCLALLVARSSEMFPQTIVADDAGLTRTSRFGKRHFIAWEDICEVIKSGTADEENVLRATYIVYGERRQMSFVLAGPGFWRNSPPERESISSSRQEAYRREIERLLATIEDRGKLTIRAQGLSKAQRA